VSAKGAGGRNPFGGNGASGSEMRFFDRQSDQFAEHLLVDPESVHPGAGHDETVAFVRALPATVPVLPDPALEAEIITALAGAARSATLDASRVATATFEAAPAATPPRWRLRVAALAATVAALPVLMAGLAYAGVNLPDVVDEAFEAAGVDLPHQGGGDRATAGSGDDDRTKASDQKNDAAGTEDTDDAPAAGDGGESQDSGKPKGNQGNAKDKPEHAGPEATPPGHGGTPPGQGGVPPGNAGVPTGGGSEGSTGPAPDAGPTVTPPGQGGTLPGQAKPK
jgi:hypothetical protein